MLTFNPCTGALEWLSIKTKLLLWSRYYSDENYKFGLISRPGMLLRWKAGALLPLVSDRIAAPLAEAVIHKQPRLIKRLSPNVPPQWVVDFQQRGQIATELIVHDELHFHFTSLLSVCFCLFLPCHALRLHSRRSSRGFRPLEPLKSVIAAQPPEVHQRTIGCVYRRSESSDGRQSGWDSE